MISERMMRAAGVSSEATVVWLDALNASAEEFEINTAARTVPWLANLSHESAGFTTLVENLNYGAAALLDYWKCTPQRTWGFTPDEARAYARKPEKIANRVYANRYGNGPESSGDGWRYRGRGIIQLTFRDNYQEFGDALGVDLIANPDDALGVVVACRVAGRFWQTRGCNELADVMDDVAIRRRINGGTNGLADVQRLIENIDAVAE